MFYNFAKNFLILPFPDFITFLRHQIAQNENQ